MIHHSHIVANLLLVIVMTYDLTFSLCYDKNWLFPIRTP